MKTRSKVALRQDRKKAPIKSKDAWGSNRPVAYVVSPSAASAMDRLLLQVEVLAKKVAALEKFVFPGANGSLAIHPDPVLIQKKELVEKIIFAVSQNYRLTQKELLTGDRRQSFVYPRQLAMYLARKFSGLNTTALGILFHKDHGTILHACRCMEDRISCDRNCASEVTAWESTIELAAAQIATKKENHS